MSDEPIIPQDYYHGLSVIHIEDLRVSRGLTRRPRSSCKHVNLTYDMNERRIYCHDCERDIDPFDAFTYLCERWDSANKKLAAREEEFLRLKESNLISVASKRLDKEFRKQHTCPACPHCGAGLLPEDFAHGEKIKTVMTMLTRAMRKRDK